MSSEHGEHGTPMPPPPSDNRLLRSMVGWVGVILIFVFILFVTYLPTREGAVDPQVTARRSKILQETQAHATELLDGYSATGGTIRIPVERAKELVLPSLREKKVRAVATPQAATQQQGDVTPAPEAPTVEPAPDAEPAEDPGLGDSRPSDE